MTAHQRRMFVHQAVERIGKDCDDVAYFLSGPRIQGMEEQLTLDEYLKLRGALEQIKIVLERSKETIEP